MAAGGMVRGVAAKVAGTVMAVVVTLLQVHQASTFGIPDFLEFGECPPISPQANLNLERYSGIWFNIEMVPNEYAEITDCSMTNYTWVGDMMLVEERGLSEDGMKMKQGSLMHPTEGQPGVLTVDAEGVPNAPYVVVATDYETYSCVHSCFAMMGFRAAFSWIMSRRPFLDPAFVTLCQDRLQEWDIDISAMIPVTQGKTCPYTNKLDAVLAYSARVQAKAEAKVTMQKVKIDSTADSVQTITNHRTQGEKDAEVVDEGVHLHEEEQQPVIRNDAAPDRRTHTQHIEPAAPSGGVVTNHNTGLLVLLLGALLLFVTSPFAL